MNDMSLCTSPFAKAIKISTSIEVRQREWASVESVQVKPARSLADMTRAIARANNSLKSLLLLVLVGRGRHGQSRSQKRLLLSRQSPLLRSRKDPFSLLAAGALTSRPTWRRRRTKKAFAIDRGLSFLRRRAFPVRATPRDQHASAEESQAGGRVGREEKTTGQSSCWKGSGWRRPRSLVAGGRSTKRARLLIGTCLNE